MVIFAVPIRTLLDAFTAEYAEVGGGSLRILCLERQVKDSQSSNVGYRFGQIVRMN